MDYRNMTAPCGIPCFECIAYKAGSSEIIKKQISERTGLDFEKSSCEGCRNRNGIGFLSEKNNIFPSGTCLLMNKNGECRIYLCAENKHIHNCSACEEFPCDKLQPLADKADRIPHNLKVYNLALIRKSGLEEWARDKAGPVMRAYMLKKFEE
jgi:hypothetical protein